jgi:hypothetical protein
MRLAHAACLALSLGCSRASASREAPAPPASPAAPGSEAGATAAPPSRDAWTAATVLRDPPVPLAPGVTGIVAHAPHGFDPSQPLHLVLFFHGSDQCVAQIAMAGEVVCKRGLRPDTGAGLAWRHDDVGTMSLFAAPQFVLWGGGTPGRLAEPGYFRTMIEELLGETFAPGLGGPKTTAEVADITLVGHSAGHLPVMSILDRGDLDDLVRNIILVDALYDGATDSYLRWLERGWARGQNRKLVAVYGTWGRNVESGRTLARRAEGLRPGSSVIDPPGALADAVRDHAVTVKAWPRVEHAWMVFLTMPKALAGLGLPPRAVFPPRELAPWTKSTPQPLSLGELREGSLDEGDARLENGARIDDYAVELQAGQRVVATLTGGRSLTEPCCSLDVLVELRAPDGHVLAADDDGAGGFDAKLEAVTPVAGTYLVRVSTSGSGDKRGPYRLRVAAAP